MWEHSQERMKSGRAQVRVYRGNSESGVLKPLSVDAGFRNKWSTNLICFVFMDEVQGCAMTSNAWKMTNTSVGVFVRGRF